MGGGEKEAPGRTGEPGYLKLGRLDELLDAVGQRSKLSEVRFMQCGVVQGRVIYTRICLVETFVAIADWSRYTGCTSGVSCNAMKFICKS